MDIIYSFEDIILLFRGYNVDVGVVEIREKSKRVQTEVDFVCNKGDDRIYIQSALNLDKHEKTVQESRPLNHIMDSFKKVIIVTQRYHLYRALYIANKLGIEAYGVEAENIPYKAINTKNEIREVLARDKDLFKVLFKPKSKFVGEPIDIKGSGEITFDE